MSTFALRPADDRSPHPEAGGRRRSAPLRIPLLAAVLASATALAGCTFGSGPDATDAAAERDAVVTGAPAEAVTAITAADAAERAASTSRALFRSSPVVVVAPTGDSPAQLVAAQVSIAWGVPLLLDAAPEPGADATPTDATPTDATPTGSTPSGRATTAAAATDAAGTEIERLGARTAFVVGEVDLEGVEIVETTVESAASASGAAIAADATLQSLTEAQPGPGGGEVDGIGTLPAVAAPLTGAIALSSATPEDAAPVATARAAGVPVTLTADGVTDLLRSPEAITAVQTAAPSATLLLGAAFAAQPDPAWSVRAATSGYQLPGGGQRHFPDHRFIAIYGTPGTGSLGVLGEQGLEATIERARAVAEPYSALSDETVVPALEIIVTVAAGEAGPDGDYSNELDPADLRPYIDAAGEAGMSVVLDLQPGRSDFLSQAQQYEDLLKLPHVGLALDPEWRLEADEVPLRQIGSVSAAEVNATATWLADLVNAEGLPPKMLVLHQFAYSMLADRETIDTTRPELEFLIHVDGQGAQPDKQATWEALHIDAPEGIAWGWKNFYDEDLPMLTPAETMAEVSPVPELVTYQ